jgi:hypothetical protein
LDVAKHKGEKDGEREVRNSYSKSDYRNKFNVSAIWRFGAYVVTYISHTSFKTLRKESPNVGF